MNQSNTYLASLPCHAQNTVLKPLKAYAKEHRIPIIADEGLRFIQQISKLTEAKNILEIGTAIGYSAIGLAKANESVQITTVERDENMQALALQHFIDYDVFERVKLVKKDALMYTPEGNTVYDLIFIDAAKAQSQRFFERFEPYLRPGGIIITDNLLFHGLVGTEPPSKNVRALTKKIEQFNAYVLNRKDFDTMIYPIGDGMSLSIKKR